jgi:hypothetical protein
VIRRSEKNRKGASSPPRKPVKMMECPVTKRIDCRDVGWAILGADLSPDQVPSIAANAAHE